MTVGSHQPVEELSMTVRRVMTGLGFLEIMTPALTCEREHYQLLGVEDEDVPRHVRLENPISVEQTMMREQLITGLLSTFRGNTTREMPQHIFEVGDCFVLDVQAETGVRTERRLAAAVAGPRAGFADARAWCEAVARELGFDVTFAPAEHGAFIPGRVASARLAGGTADWGMVGEMRPEVLEAFGLGQPVALLQVNLMQQPNRG
jgi:phenylalanyl-tRNA synthetase beta chain